jgi:hypothetical protein
MLNDWNFNADYCNLRVVTKKKVQMETNNLGDKKINGVQNNTDEGKGTNISHDNHTEEVQLKNQVISGRDGYKEVVQRADRGSVISNDANLDTTNRGVSTEEQEKKTVENKDRNSDITTNRYPNSHPDNHKNRGNMELDED